MTFYLDKEFHHNYLRSVVDRVGKSIFEPITELSVEAWLTKEPLPFDRKTEGKRRSLKIGDQWGKLWDCAWMRMTGEVPSSVKGKNVVLLIDVEGEACLYDLYGRPLQGLTHMQKPLFIFPQGKRVVWFAKKAKGGEKVDYWVDAGANDLFGDPPVSPNEEKTIGRLRLAHIAACNIEMRELYYDLLFLQGMLEILPKSRARYHRILKVMTDGCAVLAGFTEEEAIKARKIIAAEVNRRGPLDPAMTLQAIGHAHIDLAWLWPIRESKRKGVRTFASVLTNMERYPEYFFTSSQPQLLEWVRESSPYLFDRIKERVAEGRWELQGGMWVEADNNMSGGEALARQFLHGQRYFEKHFNTRTNVLWLPDCFGYSAAMPQLAKLSGVDYFISIKPSWNLFNKLPFSTFVWRGLDGTEILSHMPPADCYNTPATPKTLSLAEEQFADKALSDRALLIYGVGDGGGGPGGEHLEALRREKNTEGLPAVQHGTIVDFFKAIEPQKDSFSRWTGEIYLERHQGTFTSQAKNKRYNRQCENLLREVEFLASVRALVGAEEYPREWLDKIWKEVLLYQFHDILPGSSITRVHEESQARYEAIIAELEAYLGKSGKADTAMNPLSWDREDYVKDGSGKWRKVAVPALGFASLAAADTGSEKALKADKNSLSNGKLTVRFNKNGEIVSLFDHVLNREFAQTASAMNVYTLYHDWWTADTSDAWDMTPNYRDRIAENGVLEKVSTEVDGPVAIRRQTVKIGASTIEQEIRLKVNSNRLDFVTKVKWNERGKMLRVAFPVSIHAEVAKCEVQFGHVSRPVHQNSMIDKARFEVAAQRWVDLSQSDVGIALLNNGKYGHSLHEGRLELNVLRSPSYPDPKADTGEHEFTYALLPHVNGPTTGGVVQAAMELNNPLRLVAATKLAGKKSSKGSLLTISGEGVIIEAVKLAEDSNAVTARLYEYQGANASITLGSAEKIASAALTNILEEETGDVDIKDNSIALTFRPFEIKTVKLLLKISK